MTDPNGPHGQGTPYQEIKNSLYQKFLDEIDLASLSIMSEGGGREKMQQLLRDLLLQQRTPLTTTERDILVKEILDDVLGLGPLEPLLRDQTISNILVNGANGVYVDRSGQLELTDVKFKDDSHLLRVIDRICSRVGQRVDESSCIGHARLKDGSHVNIVVPPLSLIGPVMSIRRFPTDRIRALDLLKINTLSKKMLDLLQAVVQAKMNVLISGGTSTGKTTLLNALSSFIPENERIITIEEVAELALQKPHVIPLETRPANLEGRGAVTQHQLILSALSLRPDRLVIGEVRREGVVELLDAMNSGHEGLLMSINANTPRDALGRFLTMISMAEPNLSASTIRQLLASVIHVIVQVSRLADDSRKVTSISEVTGTDGTTIATQELFVFKRLGFAENNRIQGQFQAMGKKPVFLERLATMGISLPADIFATQ